VHPPATRVFATIFVVALALAGAVLAAGTATAVKLLAAADKEKGDGKPDDALRDYTAARDAADAAGDDKTKAAALVGMADLEYRRDHYDRTAALAAEALALAKKTGALATEADALKLIGNVNFEKADPEGDPEIGLARGRRILEIREQLGDRPGVAVALNNIGTAYKETDPLRAIEYYDRSQKEFEALGDPRRAIVLANIAEEYGVLGDFAPAIEYSHRSIALADEGGNSRTIGIVCNMRGVLETWRGDYPSALAFLDRALGMDRRADFQWGAAEVLNNIGVVYEAERSHAQAIDYLQQSLALNRKLGDRRLQAEALTNLAGELVALGRENDGAVRYREALEIARLTTIPGHQARALTGLARVDGRRGRRRRAVAEVNEAIALARSVPDLRDLANALVLLGILELPARPDVSLAVAREAVETATASENWDAIWQANLVVGRALRRQGRRGEAAEAFEASIAAIETERSRVVGPPQAWPLYFADKIESYQERAVLFLKGGDVGDALRVVEQSKSRALYDVLRAGRVSLEGALTSPERARERELRDALASLNIGLGNRPSDAVLRTRRDGKRRELEAFETTLYAEHPEIAFQRGGAPALSVSEMRSLARDTGTVVLDYLTTPARTYLFVLSPSGPVRVFPISAGASDLRRRAGELRRELAAHDLAFAAAAADLYRLLVSPARTELAAARAVVIVPDGELWSVPFAALEPRAGRYWVEDAAISYAPSLGVLRESIRVGRERAAHPAPRMLLAFGNPKTTFPSLPEAGRQVREIGGLYPAGEAEVLVEGDATEHRFREEAGRFRVLHLASHAVLDDANPLYSHVLLAEGGGDDGLLEARKLMELDLHAEMLVLSGCETARGDAPAGEGMTGMLWASFVAGTPTTVASLWRVESASTSELMVEFHRQWLANRQKGSPFAKSEALRAAARKLIASGKYAHPFYWAGFILAGSPG